MTTTERSIFRRTVNDTVFEKGKHRRIIIQIGGGKDPDVARFRLSGMRDWTDGIPLKNLFWLDFKRSVMRRWEATNKARKEAGKRKLKKPRFTDA